MWITWSNSSQLLEPPGSTNLNIAIGFSSSFELWNLSDCNKFQLTPSIRPNFWLEILNLHPADFGRFGEAKSKVIWQNSTRIENWEFEIPSLKFWNKFFGSNEKFQLLPCWWAMLLFLMNVGWNEPFKVHGGLSQMAYVHQLTSQLAVSIKTKQRLVNYVDLWDFVDAIQWTQFIERCSPDLLRIV